MQASLIAKRLQDLADEMSSSVGEHRSKLDQASQLLTSGTDTSDESLAELVVDVIGDVVRANQNLKSKLDTAEGRLQEQAVEIEAHMSRSLTDPLTGLPNRREFNARLEERMGAWNRRRDVFSLLLLDVDHFKKLNDRYGHLAGDQVLATIGRALRGAIRREDAVARFGGEEFAILLPSTSLEAGHSGGSESPRSGCPRFDQPRRSANRRDRQRRPRHDRVERAGRIADPASRLGALRSESGRAELHVPAQRHRLPAWPKARKAK